MNRKQKIQLAIFIILLGVMYLVGAEGYQKKWIIQNDIVNGSNDTGKLLDQSICLSPGMYQVEVKIRGNSGIDFELISEKEQNNICILEKKQEGIEEDKKYIIKFELQSRTSGINIQAKGETEGIYVDTVELGCLTGKNYQDRMVDIGIFCVLFIVVIYILKSKKLASEVKADCLGLIIIIILISIPVFLPYLIYGDDIYFHLNRIEGIASSLLSNQLPVRIYGDSFGGYGYAAPIYYPDLFLYLPAVLRVLGVSLMETFKVLILFINCITVYFMYYAAKKLFCSSETAFYAAVLYACAPYRLCDLYDRSAIGEALAMAFLPLVVYGVYAVIWGKKSEWMILVIGMSGVLQSHVLTVTLTGIGCVAIGIYNIRKIYKEKRLKYIGFSISCVILLNLWWLVALATFSNFSTNINTMQAQTETRAIYLTQLLFAYPDATSYMNLVGEAVSYKPLSIGLGIILGCIGLFYFKERKDMKPSILRIAIGCAALGLFAAYCATIYFPWNILRQIKGISLIVEFIQFPWRMLAFASVFLALSAGVGYSLISRKNEMAIKLVILLISLSFTLYIVQTFTENWAVLQAGESVDSYLRQNEYLPSGTEPGQLISENYIVSDDGIKIIFWEKEGTNIKIEVIAEQKGFIEVPLLYYPGYTSKNAEGIDLELQQGSNNVVRILIPEEYSGIINLKYTGIWYWNIANIISAVTLFILIGKWYVAKYLKGGMGKSKIKKRSDQERKNEDEEIY